MFALMSGHCINTVTKYFFENLLDVLKKKSYNNKKSNGWKKTLNPRFPHFS